MRNNVLKVQMWIWKKLWKADLQIKKEAFNGTVWKCVHGKLDRTIKYLYLQIIIASVVGYESVNILWYACQLDYLRLLR